MAAEDVLKNINMLQRAGYHEVVLTGVHLGAYGLDLVPQTDLYTLLSRIQTSSTIDRVRLSSIEPLELTSDIIKFVADSNRFCHHFHIPLQSGDDRILKRMNRPYSRSFFRELIFQIRESIPDAAIGVDILIGFPGETEAAFENTYVLIKELPITYLHVFPYSARTGTPASRYPHQVPATIIKNQCEKMRRLGSSKKQDFYHKFIGQDVEVLIEGQPNVVTGLSKGLTSNYIPVFANGENDLENSLVQVRLEKMFNNNSLFGTIVTF
jgi:threonylcarbamoyladenosine tRNA methylthiotransferase MtaB